MGKGKVHYIEVLSDSDGKEEAGRAQGSEHSNSDDEQPMWRIRMLSSHVWRLRVGLLPLYQVFLDFTLSGSMEYYKDSVSQSWLMVGQPTISLTQLWWLGEAFLQRTLRGLMLW
jgi:hypothetical protein